MTTEELERLKKICDDSRLWPDWYYSPGMEDEAAVYEKYGSTGSIAISETLPKDRAWFIREARTAMPVLIKEVEKLREKLEIAKEALDQLTYKGSRDCGCREVAFQILKQLEELNDDSRSD